MYVILISLNVGVRGIKSNEVSQIQIYLFCYFKSITPVILHAVKVLFNSVFIPCTLRKKTS